MEPKKKIKDMSPEEKRAYQREKTQRNRDAIRAKEQKIAQQTKDEILAEQINQEGLAYRIREGKCFIGEISPGVDAATIPEALQVAREFGSLLKIEDIRSGESLLDFERRVWDAWIARDCPMWIRSKQQLVRGWGRDYHLSFGGFEKSWILLPGSHKPMEGACGAGFQPPQKEQ